MIQELKLEKILKIGADVYERTRQNYEREIHERHNRKGREDDIHDEDELRNIIKEQNAELDFVLEREDRTETGLQRALDIQTQRAWESKEINATRQCELEIEIRELKSQCKQMKEKMSEDEEIYEMTAEDLKKQIDKKQI